MITMAISSKGQIVLPSNIRCLFGLMSGEQNEEHHLFRAAPASKLMPILGMNTSETT